MEDKICMELVYHNYNMLNVENIKKKLVSDRVLHRNSLCLIKFNGCMQRAIDQMRKKRMKCRRHRNVG